MNHTTQTIDRRIRYGLHLAATQGRVTLAPLKVPNLNNRVAAARRLAQ